MRFYIAGLLIAMIHCSCWTEATLGQANSQSKKSSSTSSVKGSRNASGFQRQFSTGNTSVSRSISFKKDGRRISITENADGITVSIDGESVQARNADELKKKSPEAYRLYKERIGAASASASMSASGGASSSATGQSNSQGSSNASGISGGGAFGGGGASGSGNGQSGSQGQFKPGNELKPGNGPAGEASNSKSSQSGSQKQSGSSSSKNRSITVLEDGRKISITENDSGITVSINGRTVRAKNAARLKKKSPYAYKMYEKHLGDHANGNESESTKLLRDNLNKLRDENADNPQLKSLIEMMLQNVGK